MRIRTDIVRVVESDELRVKDREVNQYRNESQPQTNKRRLPQPLDVKLPDTGFLAHVQFETIRILFSELLRGYLPHRGLSIGGFCAPKHELQIPVRCRGGSLLAKAFGVSVAGVLFREGLRVRTRATTAFDIRLFVIPVVRSVRVNQSLARTQPEGRGSPAGPPSIA